jgi:cysteinyl-tRNA synthetase
MMDFTWDAMTAADGKVKQMRQRMAEWSLAAQSASLSAEAATLDARFRHAITEDLDLPAAVVVLNEVAAAPISDGDKYALVASWDAVLGVDLERNARQAYEPDERVLALLMERDLAREAKDFAKSDTIRDALAEMGLEVMDTPAGTRVRPRS